MNRKNRAIHLATCILLLLLGSDLCFGQARRARRQPTGKKTNFEFGGFDRAFRIHVPKKLNKEIKVPLVLLLHGGGGTSISSSAMGMTKIAGREGFIVAYPEGWNKHWNDGRHSEVFAEQDKKIDDVKFLSALIQSLVTKYPVDRDKIFIAGVSNGGFMSQRMAMEKPELFAATGIIIASMGKAIKKDFSPSEPVSILFMNGTEDKMVPYDGGAINVNVFPRLSRLRGTNKSRGYCVSTDEAVQLWVNRNGLSQKKPKVKRLPDKVQEDNCSIETTVWSGGQRNTAVALYKVIGGGHTVPGDQDPFLEHLRGNTNRDIKAMEVLWQFFKTNARLPKTGSQTEQE